MADLAIFDLDYTLTRRGTWGRFVIMNVKTRPWLWGPLLITAGLHQWRYKRGKIERIRVKEAMMVWSMQGKSKPEMLALARKFAKNEVPGKLRPGAIRALERHKAAGDTIVVASAAADILVVAICEALDIKHWVATDMDWQEDQLMPHFKSKNCYGAEKLRRVLELLAKNPTLKHIDTVITFYSDSYSDIDMFEYCDIGVAVNPDDRLRQVAPRLGIEVTDWNT